MRKKYNSGVHEKTPERSLGNLGEDIAVRHLKEQGYFVIGKNINSRLGEIDIVAKKDKRVHFFEVKSARQSQSNFGNRVRFDPRENLTPKKLHKVIRACHSYLREHEIVGPWQLNAILVYIDEHRKSAHVELIENISAY